ncbi:MAG: Uma2 family endonuclease [Treponema sp.]|nr:Uma2 family endonuclease [Treponema sp.]
MAIAEQAGDLRLEQIDGIEYAMNSPGYKHQMAAGRILAQLNAQLSNPQYVIKAAPFDVFPLYDQGDKKTLVQPDIFIVCNCSKLHNNRYNGAPQFIIEILSSNRSHGMVTKLNLYKQAGVTEYWIIDPEDHIIIALELIAREYFHRAYSGKSTVSLASVPGCAVDFKKVFEPAM